MRFSPLTNGRADALKAVFEQLLTAVPVSGDAPDEEFCPELLWVPGDGFHGGDRYSVAINLPSEDLLLWLLENKLGRWYAAIAPEPGEIAMNLFGDETFETVEALLRPVARYVLAMIGNDYDFRVGFAPAAERESSRRLVGHSIDPDDFGDDFGGDAHDDFSLK